MKVLFAVTRICGPAWDATKPMRSQDSWNDHSAFMDQLAADGTIVLGGPVADCEFLLIFNATSEEGIAARLARDPWTSMGLLEVREMRRWTILLEAFAG